MSTQDKNAVYAILADSVYWDVRRDNKDNAPDGSKSNWTPVPSDWKLIDEMSGSGKQGKALHPEYEGFTARAYKNKQTNEIVIAYAGTEDFTKDPWYHGLSGDGKNDGLLSVGLASKQANQAAIFYQTIKSKHPASNITLTGHSLGGGLASLVGVWFNKNAVVFDPAPFKAAAMVDADTIPQYRDKPNVGTWIWDNLPDSWRSSLAKRPHLLVLPSTIKGARWH